VARSSKTLRSPCPDQDGHIEEAVFQEGNGLRTGELYQGRIGCDAEMFFRIPDPLGDESPGQFSE
jgi:hypothetical protein